MRYGLGAALAAFCLLILGAATATAAPPNPFGHPCTLQNGVRFCPTDQLTDRVPTWDGVPIDVDVTLPPDGDGPFPTIVMIHGLGGNKTSFESSDPSGGYNNVFFAQRGYAVVTPSLRGWGRTCGTPDTRTPGACDRGWTHLDDQAYEARDIQYLLGLLVDQGVTKPDAIGVTGVSLGGGLTNELAFLRNQVRLPDAGFMPWTSPNGVPLSFAAAWSRWGWSDLAYALGPNGRWLEGKSWAARRAVTPLGIEKKSFVDGFYALQSAVGNTAPAGADPNADLQSAKSQNDAGEPYSKSLADFLTVFSTTKSAAGLFQLTPSPLLVQDGWTDDVFTPQEALRIYDATANGKNGPVALQLGDLGHGRGANKPGENDFFDKQGADFFDAYLNNQAGKAPAPGSVAAFTQTCPKTLPSGGPFTAASWAAIHPGSFKLTGAKARKVTSTGGDAAASKVFDQILGGNPCGTAPAGKGKGTAVYTAKVRKGFTMLGLPLVKATIKTRGQFGQLDSQLYDVFHGKETLVSRGAYRLTPNQSGTVVFQLNGGGWKFKKGHTVELQLMGRDPNFLRPSNGRFSTIVSSLSASLPTREKKPL